MLIEFVGGCILAFSCKLYFTFCCILSPIAGCLLAVYWQAVGHLLANSQSTVSRSCSQFMHQSIPAVPIPPGNSGAFSHTFHPGGWALAFHPSISLLSPYNIVISLNDHFISKHVKFLLGYV